MSKLNSFCCQISRGRCFKPASWPSNLQQAEHFTATSLVNPAGRVPHYFLFQLRPVQHALSPLTTWPHLVLRETSARFGRSLIPTLCCGAGRLVVSTAKLTHSYLHFSFFVDFFSLFFRFSVLEFQRMGHVRQKVTEILYG